MEKILVGLIGGGIGHSLAPALHEEEARHHGLRLHYQLVDLADHPGALAQVVGAMRHIGFAGFNVTYPFKQAVIALLDGLSEEARAIGAVNTVVREGGRLVGHNTDSPGWAWGFRRALPGADLTCVALLGAGGAGAACADAALRLGAERVLVHDVEAGRAHALAERLRAQFGAARAEAVADLKAALCAATGLIQATPVGMVGHPGTPIDVALLRRGMWVSEVVYVPLETALLSAARRAGCAVMDGGHMNVGQAAGAFRLFTGREPDAARMEAHFRRLAG
ncbi:MAG: shikimate dehydrogenase [Burkholderiales bacterium]|nr:shikimate dehydrogenase [Burkholderiales bacterium]